MRLLEQTSEGRRSEILNMDRHAHRRSSVALLWVLGALVAMASLAAIKPVNQTRFGGYAIEGYDPVAYFTQEKAVKGSKDFQFSWNGAVWLFADEEDRVRFAEDPERYAPQYGGYCAYAVSKGSTATTDPEAWTIVEDKLYLNYSKRIRERWRQDVAENIRKADENWPKLLAED